ncbi:MAG: tetratricopeptide repeat protein [Myxococcales bacterium]|nr:tetratricopeptide repeat protein [Myxococcales bacterium]
MSTSQRSFGVVGVGLAAVMAAAFGGAACAPKETPIKSSESTSALGQDEIIELQTKPLRGSIWQPEALGLPPMVLVAGRASMSLDKAREAFAKASPKKKQIEAQYLATELYEASKSAPEAKPLLDEARTVLRSVGGADLNGLDENSKKMLLSFDFQVEDYAAALAVAKLLPPADGRIWEISALIRLGRIDEAAALPAKATLAKGKPSPDTIARDAYLAAWIAWRQGKSADAVAAIELAAKNWDRRFGSDVIDTETMVMMARNGATAARAVELFAGLYKGEERDKAMDRLVVAFERAGRSSEAAGVLDVIAKDGGERAVGARFKQFALSLAGSNVDEVVAAGGQLQAAASACATAKPACPPKTIDDAATEVKNVGTFMHAAFVSAHDTRYADAADALYDLYPKFPNRTDLAQVTGYKKTLADSRPRLPKGKGTHSKDMLTPLFGIHTPEIVGCYDRALLANASTSGELVTEFDVSEKGMIAAVRATPAAASTGLEPVAACITDASKAWAFPTRSMPGSTLVKMKLTFVVK